MKHTRTLKTILTIATAYRVFRYLVIYPLMASNPVTTFMLMATPYDIGLLKRTIGGEGKRESTDEPQKKWLKSQSSAIIKPESKPTLERVKAND